MQGSNGDATASVILIVDVFYLGDGRTVLTGRFEDNAPRSIVQRRADVLVAGQKAATVTILGEEMPGRVNASDKKLRAFWIDQSISLPAESLASGQCRLRVYT